MKRKILLALALVLSGGLPSFAAASLPWLPSANADSNLLDAIHAESDRKVKGQMLVAGSNRGSTRVGNTVAAAKMKPSPGRLPQIHPFPCRIVCKIARTQTYGSWMAGD